MGAQTVVPDARAVPVSVEACGVLRRSCRRLWLGVLAFLATLVMAVVAWCGGVVSSNADITANHSARITRTETHVEGMKEQLGRIEAKLDRMIERQVGP